jgi:hypothetical protein
MPRRLLAALATIVFSSVAFAQVTATAPALGYEDSYQVNYVSNLPTGTFVNFTNAGVHGGLSPAGDICINVYTYDPDEQPRNCCSCRLTPNATKSLTGADLVGNPLFPGTPTPSLVIKIVATLPTGAATATAPNTGCNAANVPGANGAAGGFASGARAWATHWHVSPFPFGTETEFSRAPLSGNELSKLTSVCSFIQTFGSTHGVCPSCPTLNALSTTTDTTQ